MISLFLRTTEGFFYVSAGDDAEGVFRPRQMEFLSFYPKSIIKDRSHWK